MTTLNFRPLRHMREIEKADSDVSDELKKPGVYIWGFLYKKSRVESSVELHELCGFECFKKYNWEIVKCDDDELKKADIEIQSASKNNKVCSNYLFVPYYVGISTDISKGVKARLEEHRKMDNGHSAKYVRLKEEFMKCYHKHLFSLNSKKKPSPTLPVFPILKGTLNNNHVWSLLAHQGYVYHFNRQSTCVLIDHAQPNRMKFAETKENGNYSITDYSQDFGNDKWVSKNDPLKNRVKKGKNGKNNFWFTYCELDYNSFLNYIKVYKLPEIEKEKEEIVDKKSKIEEFNNDIKRLGGYSKFSFEEPPKDLIEKRKWKSEIKSFFEQAEAAAYFALRGITFSRTHSVKLPEGWEIQNNSGFNIFLDSAANKKKKNVITCTPKDEFNWPGYW